MAEPFRRFKGATEKFIAIKLPRTIKEYVDASNKDEVKSIVACFSDDAFVYDWRETLVGKKAIEDRIVKTIEKYKFQFKPHSVKATANVFVVWPC